MLKNTRDNYMNLQRVQYFLIFCETLHFTEAARKLGISQPALTKAIKLLEHDVGVKLVRREGVHIHLTRYGTLIQSKYHELMNKVNEVEKEIKDIVLGANEKLLLAVTRSIDLSEISHFLYSYHSTYPHVSLEIVDCSVSESLELLMSGKVDCLFTSESGESHQQVSSIKLYKDYLGVLSSDNLHSCESKFLTAQGRSEVTVGIDSTTNPHSSKHVNSVVRCAQQLWVQQLILAGFGVSTAGSSSPSIHGVNVYADTLSMQKRQIYAELPMGRKDSRLYIDFARYLREYAW